MKKKKSEPHIVLHEIEDWLLDDIAGLCSYLRLKKVPTISGSTGYDKMLSLFRKGNKVYLKGFSAKNFIGNLNMELIRRKHSKELANLERTLNVEIK